MTADNGEAVPRSAARSTEAGRVETFSDGVFAIALTLLVLDLRPPPAGQFTEYLLGDWQTYLAYLTAFVTIGTLWAGHHDAFSRVRRVDPTTLVLNLALLLGASLVPWPATLISTAIRGGRFGDETAAILVYATVTVMIGLPYSLLDRHLANRPELLVDPADAVWLRHNSRSTIGTIGVGTVGGALAFVLPIASLVLFLLGPLAFIVAALVSDHRPSHQP